MTKKKAKALICDQCGKSYMVKGMLIKHLETHSAPNLPVPEEFTCSTCNIAFTNKGLLMCHFAKIHDSRSKRPSPAIEKQREKQKVINIKFRHVCQPCQITFYYQKDLMFHVRQHHFNLLSQIPYCNFKRVNQVWFEKVLNSKSIVEIKKVAQNILMMRKLDDNTALKVGDHPTENVDLRDIYPFHRIGGARCKYCFKVYNRKYFKKHVCGHLK